MWLLEVKITQFIHSLNQAPSGTQVELIALTLPIFGWSNIELIGTIFKKLEKFTVILLQILMVSPGTHLVKNHEFQSRTNESQLKKTSPKLKMLGPLCNQTVNLKTDSKTLYYSVHNEIKI